MTTIVISRKHGRVAIGGDSTSHLGGSNFSRLHLRNHSKLIVRGDHHFAITGDSVWRLALAEHYDRLETTPSLENSAEIYRFLLGRHAELSETQWLSGGVDEAGDAFQSTRLTALFAGPGGIFGIFPDRTVVEFQRYFALGSGFEPALGALHATYDELDSPTELVRRGLDAAACFDPTTAGPFDICEIALEGSTMAAER